MMSDPAAPAPVEAPDPIKVETPEVVNITVDPAAAATATAIVAMNETQAMEVDPPMAPIMAPPAPTENLENSIPSASHSNPGLSSNSSCVQIILPLEEFAEDLDLRLGRANGNIYKRRPGILGVHDGQVMVRLKKKRFIVIDYGIVPNEHDLQASAMSPNINVPLGGGVTKCNGKVASDPGGPLVPCKKIGVPILLYDSEPDQPPSLYLRSGLCFLCQRNLNEKRRTQRKRPADRANHQAAAKVSAHAQQSQAAFLAAQHAGMALGGPVPTLGSTTNLPGMQTVRIGGIGAQTSLVGAGTTGRVNATPHHRVLMAVTNGHKKIKLAHTNQPLVLAPDAIILNGPPDNVSCKSVRAGHGFAEIGTDLNVEVHQSLQSTQTLLHSVNTPEMMQQGIPPPTPGEISRTYDQAFYSLSKSLYLLVQWKTSWDVAISSALQQEAHAVGGQQQHGHAQGPPDPATSEASAAAEASLAIQQQNAAALQAASMANAAATAAIGGMINGVPGSVPIGISGMSVPHGNNNTNNVVHHHVNVNSIANAIPIAAPIGMSMPVQEPTLAQAVASAAAVAAVSQPEGNPAPQERKEVAHGAPLDESVEV